MSIKYFTFINIILTIQCYDKFGINCNKTFNYNALFPLEFLYQENDYSYTFTDNTTIYFNLCNFLSRGCLGTTSKRKTYGLLVNITDNVTKAENCTRMTSDHWFKDFQFNLLDDNIPKAGVKINMTNGDIVNITSNSSDRMHMEFYITCKRD